MIDTFRGHYLARFVVALIFSATTIVLPIRSQTFVTGRLEYVIHSVEFRSLPGVPSCCPRYSGGNGIGFAGLFGYQLGLSGNVRLSLGLGLYSHTGTFESDENELFSSQNGQSNSIGSFLHTLHTSILGSVVEPMIESDFLGARVEIGPSFEIPVTSKYDQEEAVNTPGFVFTDNGQRTRNQRSGEINDLQPIMTSIRANVRALFPLGNGGLMIEPALTARIGLSSVLQNEQWSLLSFGIGCRILFDNRKEEIPQPPSIEPKPTQVPIVIASEVVAPERPEILSIEAVMVDSAGQEVSGGELTVRNEVATNMYTMLTYVFFDEGSSEIPERYKRLDAPSSSEFKISSLEGTGTMEIYRNVLNVVGTRMREFPSSKITVTGCKDSRESADKENMLARSRAESVRSYLTSVFGIDTRRINIVARGLPEVASNSATPQGAAENRRVEISSQTWEVLEPISFQDTTRFTTYSDTLRFPVSPKILLKGEYKGQLDSLTWTLIVSQGQRPLKEFSGNGLPPPTLGWNLSGDGASIPRTEEDVSYRINFARGDETLLDTNGRLFSVKQKTTNQRVIERYSLIIFGFNESTVSTNNQRILSYIKQRIQPTSTVTVTGYTDVSGEADYNYRLSKKRADAISFLLNVPLDRSAGKGGEEQLYDNELPEGRLYCRTVRVTVETPLSKR